MKQLEKGLIVLGQGLLHEIHIVLQRIKSEQKVLKHEVVDVALAQILDQSRDQATVDLCLRDRETRL